MSRNSINYTYIKYRLLLNIIHSISDIRENIRVELFTYFTHQRAKCIAN